MPLAALTGSDTGEMRLNEVMVSAADVIAGPCENALAGRAAMRGFALTTCVLPLGVAGGAIRQAQALAGARSPACGEAVMQLAGQIAALRDEIYATAAAGGEGVKIRGPALRARANVLAGRAAAAALELAKGHGFVAGEAAQRRCREALFFYVWSSPPAIIEATLRALAGGEA
jgi:alkylation response protein AidB-like acyl-CoA dehydrogenase